MPRGLKRRGSDDDGGNGGATTLAMESHKKARNKSPGHERLIEQSSKPEMPLELEHLTQAYAIQSMSILSSSKMSQKISILVQRLQSCWEALQQGKSRDVITGRRPCMVMLRAKGPVASKAIGIAEIAKKTLQQHKVPWYQYLMLIGKTPEDKVKARDGMDAQGNASSGSDDDAFAPMVVESTEVASTIQGKRHPIPLLTIFLCSESVPDLRRRFGSVDIVDSCQ